MVAAIGRGHPELKSILPETDDRPAPDGFKIDPSKAEQQLGLKFIGFEQSMKDTVTRLLELQNELA